MKWTFLWFFVWVFNKHVICRDLYKGFSQADMLAKVWPGLPSCTNITATVHMVRCIYNEGGCVQLYEQEDCQGDSVKIGIHFADNKRRKLEIKNRAVSVGPCTTTVDLFSRPEYRGIRRRIQLLGASDCVNLDETQKPVASINSHNDCVMHYKESDCQGRSLRLKGHEDADKQEFLSSHLDSVSSIYVCPPNGRNENPELPKIICGSCSALGRLAKTIEEDDEYERLSLDLV